VKKGWRKTFRLASFEFLEKEITDLVGLSPSMWKELWVSGAVSLVVGSEVRSGVDSRTIFRLKKVLESFYAATPFIGVYPPAPPLLLIVAWTPAWWF
jgi:hypothetical protein